MKYGNVNLGQIEALINKLGGEEGLHRFLVGELTIKEPDLLRRITTISVPGTKRFVAKDHLKTANIGWAGDNFNKLFLKKAEENVKDLTIAVDRLEKNSLDASILAELGNRAEINLAHFFWLIEKQSKGENGPLLTNGYANIAYILGIDGNLWAVGVYWYSGRGYWRVGAVSVEDPVGWSTGCQVLSRDS